MPTLFQKLQLRAPEPLVIIDAPAEVAPAIADVDDTHGVETTLKGPARDFVLVFVRSKADVAKAAGPAAKRVKDDGLLWIAYPKKSSKRYQSDLGRDDSWAAFGALGFEPVRMIAVDEDWSALRLRRAEHIKSLTRSPEHALSAAGKARATATSPGAKKAAAKKVAAGKKAALGKKEPAAKKKPVGKKAAGKSRSKT